MMPADSPITPLPVILPSLPDELLSSWISRHALFYDVPPLVLLQHCLPLARALRSVDLTLKPADAARLACMFRSKPQSIVGMTFAAAPKIAHRMIAVQPVNRCQKCANEQVMGTVIRRYQLEGWRLHCPLCDQMLADNNDQTPFPPSNRQHLIQHGERLFQAEANGENIGWASPGELARLLLMRRVPRPLNVDPDDLPRLRVLGAIFPDFDDTVANNNIPLPSAGKPILPIGLRHFLLAAVGSVTQIGFEMLETLQSQTMGANRVRFGTFVGEMISRRQESPLCSNYETNVVSSSHN